MDLRRKRMLCQRFFAIILYLKVVAYTGKVFGRMDPQMWPSFCPLALGKVGGVCDLGREPPGRDCLGVLSSQNHQDSP